MSEGGKVVINNIENIYDAVDVALGYGWADKFSVIASVSVVVENDSQSKAASFPKDFKCMGLC